MRRRCQVKFTKLGQSLAIHIPADVDVAEKLGIRPGDEAEFEVTRNNKLQISRSRQREEAVRKIRKMRFTAPENYKFDRDEIYGR